VRLSYGNKGFTYLLTYSEFMFSLYDDSLYDDDGFLTPFLHQFGRIQYNVLLHSKHFNGVQGHVAPD